MAKKETINKSVLSERWIDTPKGKRLHQKEGVVEFWDAVKRKRDIDKLPIGKRFKNRLRTIKKYLNKKYPDLTFKIATEKSAYIDALTEQEEPLVWEAKKDKKTWSGVYPTKFKLSDIDLNPHREGIPLKRTEIIEILKENDDANYNLIMVGDIKVDLYEEKGEGSEWL